MQEQVPYELMSATDAKDAARPKQGASRGTSPCYDAASSCAQGPVGNYSYREVQTRAAMASQQEGTAALVSNAHAKGMECNETAKGHHSKHAAEARCL